MELSEGLQAFGLGLIYAISVVSYRLFSRYVLGGYVVHITFMIIVILLVLTSTYRFVMRLKNRSRGSIFRLYKKDLAFIGFMWLTMTVSVELIQHYAVYNPEEGIVMLDYNILEGRLMIFVLFLELIAPFSFGFALLKRHRHSHYSKARLRERI